MPQFVRLGSLSTLLVVLACTATMSGGRPKWIDAPNKDLLEESTTAYFAVGMAEGYSEGDLRLAATAMARQELANYINVKVEGSLKRSLAEQKNFVDHGQDVSEEVLKSTTAQSSDMVLSLTTVENYHVEKLENGRLKVYARVKLDIPAVLTQLKTLLAQAATDKKLFLEEKAAEGISGLQKALGKEFEVKP